MSRFFHFFSSAPAFSAGRRVAERLRDAGFSAFFAGGAVRDMLLGKAPSDIDIATSAVPEQIRAIFPKTHDSGVAFGVVTVHIDGFQFETATFRRECSYSDGRHPGMTVYTDSPEEDVARRDFTINGMMLDPVSGEILDFVGGQKDLRLGIVRTIGDPEQRFTEDALRILRAVRFSARYGFPLAPETEAAAEQLADNLNLLSAERIRAELEEMLTGPRPDQAFRLLEKIRALSVVLPEVAAMKGVEQPPEFHPEGDVFEHTMIMLSRLAHPSPAEAWGALLHDVGKPPAVRTGEDGKVHFYGHEAIGAEMAEKIMRRLCVSRELAGIVSSAVRDHMRFTAAHLMRKATLRRLIAEKSFPTTLEVLRTDCISCHGKMDDYLYLLDLIHGLAQEPPVPPPLLNGKDLIGKGVRPGPVMGRILKKIQELQLEGKISTKEEALAAADAEISANQNR